MAKIINVDFAFTAFNVNRALLRVLSRRQQCSTMCGVYGAETLIGLKKPLHISLQSVCITAGNEYGCVVYDIVCVAAGHLYGAFAFLPLFVYFHFSFTVHGLMHST